jgi:uracil-DNA glycosylase
MIDIPKSLGNPRHRAERLAHLHDPHIRALTLFVERIRAERRCGDAVPYFDPADGGIDAECLYVLEAPGPKAVASGFISRNNPDETAKNWFELNAEAGVPRKKTIICNIVPWYIGSDGKIRPATSGDIQHGWPYLLQLIDMLPRLRVVVLVGGKAQHIAPLLRRVRPSVRLMECPHPSPMFVNRKPDNRGRLLAVLADVARTLS